MWLAGFRTLVKEGKRFELGIVTFHDDVAKKKTDAWKLERSKLDTRCVLIIRQVLIRLRRSVLMVVYLVRVWATVTFLDSRAMISLQNAGRSAGCLEVTRFPSTTTSLSR